MSLHADIGVQPAEVPCACADLGLASKFCTVTPYCATFSYQALAASWAGFCSQKLGQEHLQLDFLNLHVFHTTQYGLDVVDHRAWQLEHPCKPDHSMLDTAVETLLQKQAPKHHPSLEVGSCIHGCMQLIVTKMTVTSK